MRIIFIWVAISMLVMASCSSSYDKELLSVEQVMNESPDSALYMLERIDTSRLASEKNRALYSLLLSQAMDKTYQYSVDDSLINVAKLYYDKTNDSYCKMLSHYYLARIFFHREDFSQCIVELFISQEYATALDDYFWKGMICRAISDVYNKTMNVAEELKYAIDEFDNFKKSGRQPHLNYALLDLARAYSNKGNNKYAIRLCQAALDSAKVSEDEYLQFDAIQLLGQCYVSNANYKEAIPIFESFLNDSVAQTCDILYLALAYSETNQMERALNLLNSVSDTCNAINYRTRYKIFKFDGKINDALIALEKYDRVVEDSFYVKVRQNLTSNVVNHYTLSKKTIESERDKSRLLSWLIGLISTLILLIVAISVFVYRKRQSAIVSENMEIARRLRHMLTEKGSEVSQARDEIKELLTSKYQLFDTLCQLVYESNDTATARRRISDTVSRLIKQMQNDSEMFIELEKFVNSHYSNLLTELKADLPQLPDGYYKLYVFSILGFSDNAISIFLNKMAVSSVWNTRRHLKDKLKTLGDEKQVKYLSYLA